MIIIIHRAGKASNCKEDNRSSSSQQTALEFVVIDDSVSILIATNKDLVHTATVVGVQPVAGKQIHQFRTLNETVTVLVDFFEELLDTLFGEELTAVHAGCQELVVVDAAVLVGIDGFHD